MRAKGGPRCPKRAPKVAQVELRRESLVAQVGPRDPLEEPRGTQDDPMATQRGAQRTKMTQDGAKGGAMVKKMFVFKLLKTICFYGINQHREVGLEL